MTSTAAPPDGLVTLQITCTNHLVKTLSRLPIQVSFTNASTNVAGVLLPVSFLFDYEVWVTNTTGRATNIVTQPAINGPPIFRGSGYWLFNPGKSVACTLDVPLPEWIGPGSYTLAIEHWCTSFLKWDETGKAVSSSERQLTSNPVQFEVEQVPVSTMDTK